MLWCCGHHTQYTLCGTSLVATTSLILPLVLAVKRTSTSRGAESATSTGAPDHSAATVGPLWQRLRSCLLVRWSVVCPHRCSPRHGGATHRTAPHRTAPPTARGGDAIASCQQRGTHSTVTLCACGWAEAKARGSGLRIWCRSWCGLARCRLAGHRAAPAAVNVSSVNSEREPSIAIVEIPGPETCGPVGTKETATRTAESQPKQNAVAVEWRSPLRKQRRAARTKCMDGLTIGTVGLSAPCSAARRRPVRPCCSRTAASQTSECSAVQSLGLLTRRRPTE